MRYCIFTVLILTSINLSGQIIGNQRVVTKNFDLENFDKVSIQMYADVIIDLETKGMTITGESNLIKFIGKDIESGVLTLDQKKWIEPTKPITIHIGAPNLKGVIHGTHDKTLVNNINGSMFEVEAPIGEVFLNGTIEHLIITSKNGLVNANDLSSSSAKVNIHGEGIVKVNAMDSIDYDIGEEGILFNKNVAVRDSAKDQLKETYFEEAEFIDIKIKNNSIKRNHFIVVGPNPNGKKFSYGFTMMPFQTKKERWTVGTKIYSENSIGERNLLKTISKNDEGATVKLFD